MGIWRQMAEYLYLKKRDPNDDRRGAIRYMHGWNRLSLFIFLIAVLVMIIRAIFFKRH